MEECIEEVKFRAEDENQRFWAVCLKENKKVIGHVYFNQEEPMEFNTWELGYVFNPKFYGQGYATEACRRILKYGFEEKKAHRIVAGANVKNESSWKLLERLYMRREGHMLQNVFFKFINDLIGGFKELSLNEKRKNEFEDDMEKSCDKYRGLYQEQNTPIT